jgi:hypothetical protein
MVMEADKNFSFEKKARADGTDFQAGTLAAEAH